MKDTWKKLVADRKDVIEDFNDFSEDRSIVWADNQIKQLTAERDELRSRNEVLESEHVEFYEKWHECRRKLEALKAERDELRAENAELESVARLNAGANKRLVEELEIERMRLAGCGVAAMSNTDESVKARINNLSPFWSASYGDVCAAVDREMSLRKELEALKSKIEGGVRVRSLRTGSNTLIASEWTGGINANATLLIDEGVEL